VEEVGERPEQVGGVGFEAGVSEGSGEDIEQVGHGAFEKGAFGEGAGIGFVVAGMIPKELKFFDDPCGLGRPVRGLVGVDM
jgi:hypothetical protein